MEGTGNSLIELADADAGAVRKHASVSISRIQLILSEKRAALAVMRRGIGVITLPLSVITVLVATSQYYDVLDTVHLLVPLLGFCVGLTVGRLRPLRLALAALAIGAGCASAGAGGLSPFATDGCSMFFDGTPAQRDLWRHCCTLHDKAYWRGGTREERKAADRRLRACVDEVEDAALAELMYEGVRAGGGPYWPTSYRWGYGWPYGRGYRPLSEDEKTMADRMLVESEVAPAAEAKAKRATSEQP